MNFRVEDYDLNMGTATCTYGASCEFTRNFTNKQLIEAASDLKFINTPDSCDEFECTYQSPAFAGQMQNIDKVCYLNTIDIINELSGDQIMKILLYICVEELELHV
jgi:hypothetical protein